MCNVWWVDRRVRLFPNRCESSKYFITRKGEIPKKWGESHILTFLIAEL